MSRRRNGGFTIAELLVALAILAVIAAIAAASISAYVTSLTVKRLNFAAEELFLYAQNRLIYAEAYGSDRLIDISFSGDVSYIMVGDGRGEEFVPKEILSALGVKSAFIELDLSSGDILAVFISERLGAEELEKELLSLDGRTPDVLSKRLIGYYGSGEHSITPREYTFVPEVRVVNNEELYIEITCDDIPNVDTSDFSVRLTLSSDDFSVENQVSVTVENGVLKARFLVDDMRTDGSSYYMSEFYPFFGYGELTAKAVIYCHGYGMTSERTAQSRSVSFDPLFEEKSGSEIKISYLRHLNNLRYLSDSAGITVLQTGDIRFGDKSIRPLPDFKGIYDGGDRFIYGLDLDADSSEYAGLFSEISGEVRNLHIVGYDGCKLTVDSGVTIAAGTICGRLNDGGTISNCSVSDISFEYAFGANGEVYAGGLAGISLGSIARSSSCADIYLNAPYADSASVGGLVGFIHGGTVAYSHSSGKLEISGSGELTAAGIAAGDEGSISSCYSECSAGYISGAVYYGVGSPDTVGEECFFVLENAWLADDDGRVSYDELSSLSITGFETPVSFVGSGAENGALPESVSVFGVPTRFGNKGLAEPRGLVGVLRVEYAGGEYSSELCACFDAYGNDSMRFPKITWNEPEENEVRYYFIVSSYASPDEGTEFGCECVIDNGSASFGESEEISSFLCRRILGLSDGDTVSLRFDSETRMIEVDLPTKAVSGGFLGGIVVIYRAQSITFDPVTGLPTIVAAHYEYTYCYIDPANGEITACTSNAVTPDRIADLEVLEFDPGYDKEIRIYAFSNEGLAQQFGGLWSFSASFSDDEPADIGEISGYRYYEVFKGSSFAGEPTIEFVYGGSPLARIRFIYSVGINGPSVTVIGAKL